MTWKYWPKKAFIKILLVFILMASWLFSDFLKEFILKTVMANPETTIPQSDKISKEISQKYGIVDNALVLNAKNNVADRIEVEVGDRTTPNNFLPQVKIKRWDDEVNVSYQLIENEKEIPQIEFDKEKIIWSKGKIESHFYDLPISEEHPEGGYELEVVLKEKPASNIIEFSLADKGVDYFYQSPLNQEPLPPNGISATETDIYDKDGKSITHRPENVVGSYAVYASENKANYVGGKEYKTGKVGHIYRPKIFDAEGTEVWGKLHIENGILSVTIPQDFLDKAVYPVIVDPTFGYETLGGSRDTELGNGDMRGSLFASGGSGDVTYKLGVYTAGGNFVGGTGSVIDNFSFIDDWIEANIVGDCSIQDANYILVAWAIQDAAPGIVLYDSGATNQGKTASSTPNGFPSSVSFSNNNNKYSIYATYEEAAGGVSVSITPGGNIEYGTILGGQSKNTIDISETQTATNDGGATANFNIKTSGATNGTSWTVGSSAGNNVFVHEFSTNGGSNWTKFTAADSYQTLATGVDVEETVDLDLKITVPTNSDAQEKTITVTVQAVAP
jgi:hypothetical protein